MVGARTNGADGSRRKIRTAIAISQSELCAFDAHLRHFPGGIWRVPLDPPPAENGHWPSLASALGDLAGLLGVTQGTLAVSLLPPFTEARRLELPPLRDDELQRVLVRNASRYFVAVKGPPVVGASLAGRRVRNAPTPVIAAAASARLVGAIRAAATQAGWTIDVIAPAEGAWAAAAMAVWPSFGKQAACVLVAHDDRTDLLQIDDGRLVGVRRFRAGAADAEMIADVIAPSLSPVTRSSVRVGAFGDPIQRKQLSAALATHGVGVSSPAGEWVTTAERPESFAAQFVGTEIGPVLRSEDRIAAERDQLQRTTWWVAGAAAALFAVAAAIELWGVRHQLALVKAEREQLRPEIASTMVGRTTVDAAYRHLATLSVVERSSPHWSQVIGTLTDAVPDDAYLVALRTRDDSVIVDGLAERAKRVFDALEKADGLTGVRAAAPVRRELQEGGTDALEHFVIAARVQPVEPPKRAVPASNTSVRRRGQ
jgi:Tfp pilus assembly protein PilN